MGTHVSVRINVPYIARVGSIAINCFRVSKKIIIVGWNQGQMDNIFVSVRETVAGWFGHATVLSPDDPVSDQPTIIYRRRFQSARYPDQRALLVRVAHVQEH
jgi:hypothetical protein